MKLFDLTKKVLVQKVEHREKSEGKYEETKFYGTLDKELQDFFDIDTDIDFDKSFSSLKKMGELKKDLVRVKSKASLIDLEIEGLVNRIRLIDNTKEHEEVTARIMELGEKRVDAEAEAETAEMNSSIDALTSLKVKLTLGDKVICETREDFENLDSYALLSLLSLVSGFLSKRERIIPLPK